ncbi:MAG: ribbon-helix-helix protein, CopG family [Gammaproteobacteria bacterium]
MQIIADIDMNTAKKLEDIARQNGMSGSDLLRDAIANFIADHDDIVASEIARDDFNDDIIDWDVAKNELLSKD